MLKDARLLMAHATAREIQTLMLLLSVGSRRDDPRAWIVAKDDGRTRRQLEEVGRAARARGGRRRDARRSVRAPCASSSIGWARIRMRWRCSKPPNATTDEVVDYWRALIHGRVLLALGRPQEAIASFERATAAQTRRADAGRGAHVTIFLKLGDREQALGMGRTRADDDREPQRSLAAVLERQRPVSRAMARRPQGVPAVSARLAALLVLPLAGLTAAAQQPMFQLGDVVDHGRRRRSSATEQPVTGLTARDFRLTDRGVLQTITDVSREQFPVDVTFRGRSRRQRRGSLARRVPSGI